MQTEDERKEYYHDYYAKHRQVRNKRQKEYYQKNLEKCRAYQREYRKTHPSKPKKIDGCCKDCFNCTLPDCVIDGINIPGGDWTHLTLKDGYVPTTAKEQIIKLNRVHDPREKIYTASGDLAGTWGDFYKKKQAYSKKKYQREKAAKANAKQEIPAMG